MIQTRDFRDRATSHEAESIVAFYIVQSLDSHLMTMSKTSSLQVSKFVQVFDSRLSFVVRRVLLKGFCSAFYLDGGF